MQHDSLRVARKELSAFFASPVAYIFLGSFLLVCLFIFFWGEAFFARNIADVRPLFDWMPILLIFLVAALTMRMWSEERRMGTLEHLLTLPVQPLQLLFGKFLAAMTLLALALLLTLPLPVTVSLIGPLDWGPVWGGYLAALFLGAAYISIGLYLSARSENQIVSLISTVLVCGVFYLLGSDLLTSFFDNRTAEIFKLFGSGSRFASITRGVIDLRDLYYYASLVGVFFVLTLYSLEKLRWSKGGEAGRHRGYALLVLLMVANLVCGNLWMQQIGSARLDLTEGRIYSISPATRSYLRQLQQPLLIRGYFSAKTHPLLAPLVPRLRDLIREYQVAGGSRVHVEFIDPQEHPDLEAEANQKYGIKPVPFQVADRYQSSLINSYFHLLIQYGDQYQVLGFRDLIEIKQHGETGLDVELRNPEYEITRSIRKVMYGFQGGGDLFASLTRPLTLTGYISADQQLPEFLKNFRRELQTLADELGQQAGDKFHFEIKDPDVDGGALAREIEQKYGYRPMQAGLFDSRRFYFYLNLSDGDQQLQVPLPHDFTRESLKQNLLATLKRFSPGYLKTVALAVPRPAANPYMSHYGLDNSKQFETLRKQLEANHNVRTIDLEQGRIPEIADILVVVAPEQLTDKGVFAIDQFLMKGGTVMLATSPYLVSLNRDSLTARTRTGPLLAWLKHNGLTLQQKMVLDPRNQPFPIPVTRNVGGFSLRELRMVPYPYFVDVRAEGLNPGLPVTSGLNQVMINWASPIETDAQKTAGMKVDWLLKSSAESWTSTSTNLIPRLEHYGRAGFTPGKDRGEKLLAVALTGRFDSYFKGKPSPLLEKQDKAAGKTGNNRDKQAKQELDSVIERSPESARLVLFGSSDFLSDQTLQLAASAAGQEQLGALQLLDNTLDWSLEDPGLLSIRSRGHYARTLLPLTRETQIGWEYLNYALVLVGLLLVFVAYRLRSRRVRQRYQLLLEGRN
ncbi:ABC transporter permease [Geothermobacter hydrogeniphilus]|uniref:ABC transporter permease n=1 Tax=Geothermobacter hydrogeniphilus TaxID=1969733 RepID=A0A2K2H9D7_9BACT|nr:Gldg family protein [Geothermobacter hydrogeniphilus]PNU19924.1 ABC transporter permease [Geothermobacter hydrogeniphilus]